MYVLSAGCTEAFITSGGRVGANGLSFRHGLRTTAQRSSVLMSIRCYTHTHNRQSRCG